MHWRKILYIGVIWVLTTIKTSYFDLDTAFAQESLWSNTTTYQGLAESLITTPLGLILGEYDTRLWNKPYNGLYISKDKGSNFENINQLKDRGITSLAYADNYVYATTYYHVNNENGLFISKVPNFNWQNSGPKVSTSTASAYRNNILLGTYSHGLWVSKDNGNSWVQKIGDGYTGPKVFQTHIMEDSIGIAALNSNTYISKDNLETWVEITQLKNKPIRVLKSHENRLFAGTSNTEGLWTSTDFGTTWTKNSNWGDKKVDSLFIFLETVYASSNGEIYKSSDWGQNWENTYLNKTNTAVKALTGLFAENPVILALINQVGIYSLNHTQSLQITPFLKAPWNMINTKELIQKIYSFFDHEYPLLAYNLNPEAEENKDTTLNFLGIRDKQPNLYYSGHDGIDFALPFGTNILATADGNAKYGFDQYGLGHYITIDHPNGYKTIYAHLQEIGLITKSTETPVSVMQGAVIGKVGMSGNTTGPHLHFAVVKSAVQTPDNRVDPFGWLNFKLKDPWANYTWQDVRGNHTGATSYNLWIDNPQQTQNENVEVSIPDNATEQAYTIKANPYGIPKTIASQNNLKFIEGTSMIIELVNYLGENISLLNSKAQITYNLSNLDLSEILIKTLKIYYWENDSMLWKPIESFYDAINNKLIGLTDHFSWFAVAGISENSWTKSLIIKSAEFFVDNNWAIN